MKRFSLSERDIDRLLSGRQPADGSEDLLAAFFCSARRVLLLPPDQKTETAHLAAVLAAARPHRSATVLPVAGAGRAGGPRTLGLRLRAAAVKVTIAALGLTTTSAGLAMAGVDLPGTVAEKAFRAVGITLPNQSQDVSGSENASGTSDRVQEAVRGRDGSMSGCQFGASASRAARGVPEGDDTEHCNRPGDGESATKKDFGTGRGPKPQAPGRSKDHAGGVDSNPGTGGTPPGQHGTEQGKAGTPTGQVDPAGGGDPPAEANPQEDGGTAPGNQSTKPDK